MRFRAKLSELGQFKVSCMIDVCFDLLMIIGIRHSHAWIRDVWWRIYVMMCLILISGTNVLDHDELLLFIFFKRKKMKFDLRPRFRSIFCHEIAFSYVCLGFARDWCMRFPMRVSDWLSLALTCVDCQHLNETHRFRLQRAFHYSNSLPVWFLASVIFSNASVIISFPSYFLCLLHMLFFIFSSSCKIHIKLNNHPKIARFFALCCIFCLLFFDHIFTNCAWLNIFWC